MRLWQIAALIVVVPAMVLAGAAWVAWGWEQFARELDRRRGR